MDACRVYMIVKYRDMRYNIIDFCVRAFLGLAVGLGPEVGRQLRLRGCESGDWLVSLEALDPQWIYPLANSALRPS